MLCWITNRWYYVSVWIQMGVCYFLSVNVHVSLQVYANAAFAHTVLSSTDVLEIPDCLRSPPCPKDSLRSGELMKTPWRYGNVWVQWINMVSKFIILEFQTHTHRPRLREVTRSLAVLSGLFYCLAILYANNCHNCFCQSHHRLCKDFWNNSSL